ncbi:MAG: DUF1566 domain-containing protein [bacterium]|nr:DUF1566 domain-containing protein [bacterium]
MRVLEAAVAVMFNKPNENYYIDPVFSRQQHSIITGDMINEFRVWAVSFNYGRIFRLSRNERDFVRPVRSVASR